MQTVLLYSRREIDHALFAGAFSAGFSASTGALIAERPCAPRDLHLARPVVPIRRDRGRSRRAHAHPTLRGRYGPRFPTRAAQAAAA